MKKLAFLVSGSGTNLQAVMNACSSGEIKGRIDLVISTSPYAYALVRAESAHIANFSLPLSSFKTKEDRDAEILSLLKRYDIDYVVLAGYRAILSKNVVAESQNRIITLHASLLPKYGGKGFVGERIHRAVLAMREVESGATAFFVTNEVDKGPIIEQRKLRVGRGDNPRTLQERILKQIEHPMLVSIIRDLCEDKIRVENSQVIRDQEV